MDKDLVSGAIGSAGKWDIAFKDGKLMLSAEYDPDLASIGLSVAIGAKQVLEALKVAIPGTIDDAIFSVIEGALGL